MDQYLPNILKRQESPLSDKTLSRPKNHRCISPLAVAMALTLLAIFVFLSGCSNDEFVQRLASVEAQVERLEARLTQTEKRMEKIVQLENQITELEKSLSELKRLANPITEGIRYHAVRRGDSLSGIAEEYGITVQELRGLNEIAPGTIIRPGDMLLVRPGI